MNFLTGLGSLALGIPQGIQWEQALTQTQGRSALGDALAARFGGSTGGQQQPQGLGGVIQNLFGGQSNQPQTAQLPQIPEQQPLSTPQTAPAANMPMTLPGAQTNGAPITPAPQPPPLVANTAGPPGMQGQPAGAQPGPQPQPQPQPSAAPASPDPTQYARMQMMQQRQANKQTPPLGEGALDLPTLVQLIHQARPGIRGSAMMAALDAAMPLLHEQGLQQFKGMENQLKEATLGLREERLYQQAEQFGETQREKRREFDTRQGNIMDRFNRSMAEKEKLAGNSADERARLAKYKEAAQAIVFSRDMKDDEKHRRLDELDQQFDQERAMSSHKPGEIRVLQGRKMRFKGGDWDSEDDWEPVKQGQ